MTLLAMKVFIDKKPHLVSKKDKQISSREQINTHLEYKNLRHNIILQETQIWMKKNPKLLNPFSRIFFFEIWKMPTRSTHVLDAFLSAYFMKRATCNHRANKNKGKQMEVYRTNLRMCTFHPQTYETYCYPSLW